MSGHKTLYVMLAASFASTIGGLPFNTLPVLLGSLADTFGFSTEHLGALGSACFAGYLFGTLLSVVCMDRMNWRWLTLGCAGGAVFVLLVSSQMPGKAQLPLWLLLGFFSALMTCLGLRIMAEMADKERALGLRQGIELALVAVVLFSLPSLVIARFHYSGAALFLAAIILVLSASAFVLPQRSDLAKPAVTNQSLAASFRLPPAAYTALILFFLFGTGQIGLWAFLERFGNALALQPTELGIVFAVLKLLGGAAALVLALTGTRLSLGKPYLLTFVTISVGLLLLGKAEGFLLYAFGAWIWEVGFTWGCIFQTAAVARLDPSGRSIMLIPAAFALSSIAGPMLAGKLIGEGFSPLLWLALGCAVIPLIGFSLLKLRRTTTKQLPSTAAA
jgi:hypothetical protein